MDRDYRKFHIVDVVVVRTMLERVGDDLRVVGADSAGAVVTNASAHLCGKCHGSI